MASKLIVIRGPSGSGKSTVAKALFKNATRKTCLIEQDYYRFIFKSRDDGSKANSATIHKMIKDNILTALNDGYDVILEGILASQSYVDDLNEIISKHPSGNYLFYFDISLEETLRRHRTRPSRNTSTYKEGDLQTFYPGAYMPAHENEHIISEASSADEILAHIIAVSNL
jgi:thymidylate kinase